VLRYLIANDSKFIDLKLTPPTYSLSMPIFGVLFFSAAMLSVIQWQFSRLTGSSLIFGQSLLQLSLCLLLLFYYAKPSQKSLLLAQFFSSFIILVLCGLLINESYISWHENATILTKQAFPVIILGLGGALFLSRMIYLFIKEDQPNTAPEKGRKWISYLSFFVLFSIIIVHFTGWAWLDALVASFIGIILGISAIFFLLDSYWNMMDISN